MNPTEPLYFFNRAYCQFKLRRYQWAIENFTQAIQLSPNLLKASEALQGRGDVHLKLRQYWLALEDYTAVLQEAPHSLEALCGRGVAHLKVGRYQLAVEDYTQVLQLNPTCVKALIGRDNAQRKLREYEAAIEYYHQTSHTGEEKIKEELQNLNISAAYTQPISGLIKQSLLATPLSSDLNLDRVALDA